MSAACTCVPCTTPAYGAYGVAAYTHGADCCSGALVEEYDEQCPAPAHREMAGRQFPATSPGRPSPAGDAAPGDGAPHPAAPVGPSGCWYCGEPTGFSVGGRSVCVGHLPAGAEWSCSGCGVALAHHITRAEFRQYRTYKGQGCADHPASSLWCERCGEPISAEVLDAAEGVGAAREVAVPTLPGAAGPAVRRGTSPAAPPATTTHRSGAPSPGPAGRADDTARTGR